MVEHVSKTCCAPDAKRSLRPQQIDGRASPEYVDAIDKAEIPGGQALIGTDATLIDADCEGPLRRKRVAPFRIARTVVTNAEFGCFVDATGYVTEAERFGWSFVFWAHVPESLGATQAVAGAEWWRQVEGAHWREAHGPGRDVAAELPDHPVVHVSWHDARAYAAWVGGRLPNEAEWEHAARGGLGDVPFSWGEEEPGDAGDAPCNIWRGRFPASNAGPHAETGTAPAASYAANGYGLYNMLGNVWEWSAEPFRLRSGRREAKARQAEMRGYKLAKGGSFLCHRSYCYRYRIAARIGNSPDSTTTHTGFRVVWD